jgi:hypothetical protein
MEEEVKNHYLIVVQQWIGETKDPARLYVVQSTSLKKACIRAISVRSNHNAPSEKFMAHLEDGLSTTEDVWQYESCQQRIGTFSSWPGVEDATGRTYTLPEDNIMLSDVVADLLIQKHTYIQ